jgi:rod shape-determining protein MreC
VVPIFTHRDDRKLFALAGVLIVAAILALLQLDAARSGRTSALTAGVTTVGTYAQLATSSIIHGVQDAWTTVVQTPQLATQNTQLQAENARLTEENRTLTETLARVPAERDITLAQERRPDGIAATVIGYDPEASQRIITIDRGAKDHVSVDEGVVTAAGVVGRIIEVAPLSAKVLLITDITSKLPAVLQRGRWWSIAVGTQSRIRLQYVSQDARPRVDDIVVTGEGRSFRAGYPIGRIVSVDAKSAGALDQSAVVEPAVSLGSISRVLVLPK